MIGMAATILSIEDANGSYSASRSIDRLDRPLKAPHLKYAPEYATGKSMCPCAWSSGLGDDS